MEEKYFYDNVDLNKIEDTINSDIFKKKRDPWKVVTRFAPSPTWLMHIWNLYTAYLSKKIADQNNWIFILRIEDTDEKRKLDNWIEYIIEWLKNFEVEYDEWPITYEASKGEFGPYIQSQRKKIYAHFAYELFKKWYAYPCFLTDENIDQIRKEQTKKGIHIGIYWEYSPRRDADPIQVKQALEEGGKYTIRLRSPWLNAARSHFKDWLRGDISFPENIMDIVLIKSDGLPTYHFAHVIDDHLMWVNTVIRSDERISSTPIHLQLFDLLSRQAPSYTHISPLLKMDGATVRKISKRKDPEAGVSFYYQEWYPIQALKTYFLTLYSGHFEDRKKDNIDAPIESFFVHPENMSKSWAIVDIKKLDMISKEYLWTLSQEDFFYWVFDRTKKYDTEFHKIIAGNLSFAQMVFWLDHTENGFCRRFSKYSEIGQFKFFFWDYDSKIHDAAKEELKNYDYRLIDCAKRYFSTLDHIQDSKENRFLQFKAFLIEQNIAINNKTYNSQFHYGTIQDIVKVINLLLSWSSKMPDLYLVLKIIWLDRVKGKINLHS